MSLNTKLWPHQRDAVAFVIDHPHAMLAMGMRTGKTLTTLAAIEALDLRRVLIIAGKTPVREVWKYQIAQHTDRQDVVDLSYGTMEKRAERVQGEGIFLVNYEAIYREPLYSALIQSWDLVVVDESHRIKSNTSLVSKAAHRIGKHAARRLCLTGTPYKENPLDIYGQLRFLDERLIEVPSRYGGGKTSRYWTDFKYFYADLFALPGRRGVMIPRGYKNLDKLQARLNEVAHLVRTEDVRDVPPSQHIDVRVELSSRIKRAYQELAREFVTEISDQTITAANVLVKSLKLRYLADGWVDAKTPAHDAKLKEVIRLAEEAGDQPFVVFASFIHELDAIKASLVKAGVTVSELSGRRAEYRTWAEGQTQALICQYEAGAEAFDMSRAGITVFFSPTYSLSTWEQALARTKMHPDGLVTYYRIIAADTIDELIYAAIAGKRSVIQELLTNGN